MRTKVFNDESYLAVNVRTKSLGKAVYWDKIHWTASWQQLSRSIWGANEDIC